jgi:hypothetical protein
MSQYQHWADVLKLRKEITDASGQIADLQMSLYSAVYTDRDVPYQDPGYYAQITEPTPGLLRFMGRIARLLGTDAQGKALFHLDQGMGGGKSHALVGLYHLANRPVDFLATELGQQVQSEAEQLGSPLNLSSAQVVVLSADNMTPGATSPEFGPATTLYERFLWSLFKGDKARYNQHLAEGPNKAALARALRAADSPVLILLDELMDYVMQLSDQRYVASMPGEKAFLNNLMDAVDDVPHVAFVVVMIRSDLDERGYTVEAEDFRAYVAARMERNGETVAVTEAQDFSAIIRRRLFEPAEDHPIQAVAEDWTGDADPAWREQVFAKLGATRNLAGFAERLVGTYPFSPDLMTLVRDDWSRHAGFQRVRSTVEIFAATAYYWIREHQAGRWAAPLIGVGDLPLTVAGEQILSSGLLHGNDRAIQGYRQVAATDVISKDGTQGRAHDLDAVLASRGVDVGQPHPAVRMATALFCYSLVPRAQAKRGATKAELLAAVYQSGGVAFHAAEEVFNVLTGDEEGLGALEVTESATSRAAARYHLTIAQSLRMFFRQAKNSVQPNDRDAYLWERTKELAKANQGYFDQLIPVPAPDVQGAPLAQVFADVDQNGKTRLVILDPRRWTLQNGRDAPTRDEVATLLGVGDQTLPIDNAASCVVACATTQRRDTVRRRATEMLAWKAVLSDYLDADDDRRGEARDELREANGRVDTDLLKAFQHFAFLTRTEHVEVDWQRFDDDTKSTLKGSHVWDALVSRGRAVNPARLSGDYLKTLLSRIRRTLTLKEVAQQFYKNAGFPMVVSVEDIRRAIFQTLTPPDPYEIVDGNGEVQNISSMDDLSIGSMELSLRRATGVRPASGDPGVDGSGTDSGGAGGTTGTTGGSGAGGAAGGGASPAGGSAALYREYKLEVPNRSLVDHDVRRELSNLLQALLDTVDPDTGGDLQLIDLNVSLTAAPEAVEDIGRRAQTANAAWREEELDF